MSYLFFFGNAPELAAAELSAVLGQFNLSFRCPLATPEYAFIETESLPDELPKRLGGTVKIGKVFDLERISEKEVVDKISFELIKIAKEEGRTKLDFGLSFSGGAERQTGLSLGSLNKKVKSVLSDQGFKVRFVLPREGSSLSTVVITKQNLIEVTLVPSASEVALAKTIWVQDWQDWGKRDYGRPEAEGHIGMLPPKVARMMVNLSLPAPSRESPVTIIDPFCGTGTILAEGLMVGAKVIGSDISQPQLERAKTNLEWLSRTYNIEPTRFSLLTADARQISKKMSPKSVAAIVTEPNLGPNINFPSAFTPQVLKRLEDLYLDCLSDWKNVLEKGGKIVIALPSFFFSKDDHSHQILVDKVIDKAKIMGYSLLAGPFIYGRPQAIVKRNICVFQRI